LVVYHGLRRKHLQSYLDEFVFSFNRRRTRQAAFRTLLGIRHRATAPSLQDFDLTGSSGISPHSPDKTAILSARAAVLG
jgi:hypothetical protein